MAINMSGPTVIHDPDCINTNISFAVTWQDEDGTVLATDQVLYGVTPEYSGDTPTKDGYTFAGWTPTVVKVTEPATYTATYTETD